MTKPTLYIGADHGGFAYKQQLVEQLRSSDYDVQDLGAHQLDPQDDYTRFGQAVAEAVRDNPHSRGLVLCRSGHGMVMTANKIKGVRCILATPDQAWTTQSVEHDAANVLAIGVDYINTDKLLPIILAWLQAEYQGGRHQRRLDQLNQLDNHILPILD